ncbi:MAG: LptA/OstA family protein [Pyrinomonadaceae bacterium]
MTERKPNKYAIRATLPAVLRYAAIFAALLTIIAVGIGFYVATSKPEFRGKEFPAALSKNLTGVVNGYKRRETENGIPKYMVVADIARTFDDNHQELDNVRLELYKNGDTAVFDSIASEKAVYIPKAGTKDFTIFFAGDVLLKTSDALQVRTDQLNYKSETKIALAEEYLEFDRGGISGNSVGATVEIEKKLLALHRDVHVSAIGGTGDEIDKMGIKSAEMNANNAVVDGVAEIVRLRGAVDINVVPAEKSGYRQPTSIHARSADVFFEEKAVRRVELENDVVISQPGSGGNDGGMTSRAGRAVAEITGQVDRVEMSRGVTIETVRDGKKISSKSSNAVYRRASAMYELNGGVLIESIRNDSPVKATSENAVYHQTTGEIQLRGNAVLSQGGDKITGETLKGLLNSDNRLVFASSESSAKLNQQRSGRRVEASSDSMKAWFDNGQEVSRAEARGRSVINVVPDEKSRYSSFEVKAPTGVDFKFEAGGTIAEIRTLGRTTLALDPGSNPSDRSYRSVTADEIRTFFRPSTNELSEAKAKGDAVLSISPAAGSSSDYSTQVRSESLQCSFYPGNNARSCVTGKPGTAERTFSSGARPKQKIQADTLTADFDAKSKEVSLFKGSGNAKFNEGERNGIAGSITYSPIEKMVRLRNGEPTVWDNRARARAGAIDWDIGAEKSRLTGGVSTTYFNLRQTGGAAPFTESGTPVFITANEASFDHRARVAVYSGNARAWQEKNYVRGNSLQIEESAGRFLARGNVETGLYDVGKTVGGKNSKQPVFVKAGSMRYERAESRLSYNEKVDIRQGSERILADSAEVLLDSNNSLTKTVATGNVVITQPGRKATADWAAYDAIAETIEMKGDPASFVDSNSGSTSGKVVKVDLKSKKAVNSGSSTKNGSGRIRSVYKVRDGRLN